MQEALNTPSRIIRLAFYFNLLLLLVAERSDSWSDVKLMLPWALAFASRNNRAHLLHIFLSHKQMIAASAALSLFIAMGCQAHACTTTELRSALIPVLWIPIAALIQSVKSDDHAPIFLTAGIAVTATAVFIFWQYFVEKSDRPAGFSFNVLSAPMILGALCLMGAAGEHLRTGSSSRRYFYVASGLGIAAAVLTDAKTGLLTFIVGTLVHMVANREKALKTLALTLPIALIWAFALSSKIHSIQVDIAHYHKNEYRSSFGERTDALRWGREHLLDSPLLGKGSEQLRDQFNLRWQEWNRAESSITRMPHLHNDYLQLALSKGIPAVLCFVMLWLGLIAHCARAARQHQGKAAWILSLVGIYLTAFMTDSFTHWNNTWAAAIACAGIGYGLVEQSLAPALSTAKTANQNENTESKFA